MTAEPRLTLYRASLRRRIEQAPTVPPSYVQLLKDAIKHIDKAVFALDSADMIIEGGDCEHGFSRHTGGHPKDCPVCPPV